MRNNPSDWRDRADRTLAQYRAIRAARGAIHRERSAERQHLHERVETCRRHALEIEAHYARLPPDHQGRTDITYQNFMHTRARAKVELDDAIRALNHYDAATAASMPPLDEALAGRLEDAACRLELDRRSHMLGVTVR